MNSVIRNIVEQLDIMSYLNVLSFSVLSGCGTSISPSLNDLDMIEELCKDMSPNQMPYNVFFMNGLYSRGVPIYSEETENPYNLEGYQWLNKKSKKTIDIEVMACSIICCCSLIEKLMTNQIQPENSQFITFMLFMTALQQGKFIKRHLKIGDLYYSGEDNSENSKDLHIQITSKDPDRVSQFLTLQAFTALKRLGNFNVPYLYIKNGEFEEDLELLHPLYDEMLEHISEIKSKDLASIGLCIAGIYVSGDQPCKTAYNTLERIGSELLKRLGENGEVARSGSDAMGSSAATLFNCLNLLSQIYYMFGNKTYFHGCTKIYNRLNSFWDKEHGIFKFKDSNKQSYSIKDISAGIAALLSFYAALPDSKFIEPLEEQIKGLFDTAFVKSHIFSGQCRPILEQQFMSLPVYEEAVPNTAPVFKKAFEYKINKGKFYCDADVFRADYVLTACRLLLNNISSYCI